MWRMAGMPETLEVGLGCEARCHMVPPFDGPTLGPLGRSSTGGGTSLTRKLGQQRLRMLRKDLQVVDLGPNAPPNLRRSQVRPSLW